MKSKIIAAALGTILSIQGIFFSAVSADASEADALLPDCKELPVFDLNDDGVFNVADIVKLQMHISRKTVIDEKRLMSADMNGDGKVNVFDLVMMKRKLAEENSAPPNGLSPETERPLLTIENYDEYEKFIADNSPENEFVVYDDIKYIGDFKNFVVLSDFRINDYSEIMYKLEDSTGASLSLYITKLTENYKAEQADKQLPEYAIYWRNMRITLNIGISGSFTYDGKTYKYVNGKLLSLSWNDNGFEYRLMCGDSMLYNYPYSHTLEPLNTYVSGLLEIDRDPVEIDLPLLSFDTLEEYNKYVDENFLRKRIVTYDSIRCAGEFKSAAVLSNDWSQLMYTLDDGSGHEINFYVKEREKNESDTLPRISEGEIDFSDMRRIRNGDASGFFDINNRRYTYVNGELQSVSWNHYYKYTITGDTMLTDYPIDSDTFTSVMLKITDSPADTPVSLPLITFYYETGVNGLKEYIAENLLSEKIITFNDLRYMDAYSCTFLSNDGSKLIYGIDGSRGNIGFYLTLEKTDGSEQNTVSDIPKSEIDLSDMRTTKSADISGNYVCNGRVYKYVRGTLISVSWIYDEYKCTLTGGLMFGEYSLKSRTYVSSCLLKINNSPEEPVDLYTTRFDSFRGYEQYVAENSLKGRVVTYDDFSYIGGFKSAVVTAGDWSRLLYKLDDGSGYEIGLYTYNPPKHSETDKLPDIPESEINFYDMRKTKSEDTRGVFEYDGRKYQYVSGKLLYVLWTDNNCEYELTGNSYLDKYPLEADTFTASLLKIKEPDISIDDYSEYIPFDDYGEYISFDDYGEYKHYIYDNSLDGKIIAYYDLPHIGRFKRCSVRTDDWSDILYTFNDGSKDDIFLNIVKYDGSEEDVLQLIPESEVDLHDKRKTKSVGIDGYFEYCNIRFTYTDGKLVSISWLDQSLDGIRYKCTLSIGGKLWEYNINGETYISKMLKFSDTITANAEKE